MSATDKELQILHSEWLRNPITKRAMEIMKNHEALVCTSIANASSSDSVTDSKVRQYAVQLATTKILSTLLFNSSEFVAKSVNNKQQ